MRGSNGMKVRSPNVGESSGIGNLARRGKVEEGDGGRTGGPRLETRDVTKY
jgi:hypothetical protein